MNVGDIVEYQGVSFGNCGMARGQRAQVQEIHEQCVQVRAFTSDGRESGCGAIPTEQLTVVDCPETRRLAAMADEYARRLRARLDAESAAMAAAERAAYAAVAVDCDCSPEHVERIVRAFNRRYDDPRW